MNSILDAWNRSSKSWNHLIENDSIASRKEVTNKAIIDIVCSISPSFVLDIGCGEGWLCRALEEKNINATGIDGVQELINFAKRKGSSEFYCYNYHEIRNGHLTLTQKFNAIVFNYSLFEKEGIKELFQALLPFLDDAGSIFVQTLHPKHEAFAYKKSKWVKENWHGLPGKLAPFQWYYRTMDDWKKLFIQSKLQLVKAEETFVTSSESPFSVIFHLKVKS